ncbi:hypothetical protein Nizo2494_0770 [Lactiplantibacillus plantarum]|nr:hypothetical protein Nizo2457_0080 [Lactiplantibacillus plantarum]KZU30175.1 hypothetical protein Nizo2494_0770 [Lactiplantibacillus plantarum]
MKNTVVVTHNPDKATATVSHELGEISLGTAVRRCDTSAHRLQ